VVLSEGEESGWIYGPLHRNPLSYEGTEETDCAEEAESPEEAESTEDSVGDGDAGLRRRRRIKERSKSGKAAKQLATY
jgi:hypothetical protein